jgi:hypothetical protein
MWGWRREWDSNPRDPYEPTRVPGVRLQPLGHLSVRVGNARHYSHSEAERNKGAKCAAAAAPSAIFAARHARASPVGYAIGCPLREKPAVRLDRRDLAPQKWL